MKKSHSEKKHSEAKQAVETDNLNVSPEAEAKVLGKVAVIGEKDVVLVFKAVGAEIFPFTHTSKIKETIKNLIEKRYAVILIMEREAQSVNEYLETLHAQTYPIIVPIPNGLENLGYGLGLVQNNIVKAIGSH